MTMQVLFRFARHRAPASRLGYPARSGAGWDTLWSLLAMLLIQTLLSLMPARNAYAENLLVDNVRGSDQQRRDSGGELRSPFRTLQKAIDSVEIGDMITVTNTGVPYHETVSLGTQRRLGTARFPLVIEGNGAIFDGSQELTNFDWEGAGSDLFELKVASPGYVKLFSGEPDTALKHIGHLQDLSTLQPLQYGRHLGAVYLRTRPGDVPHNYGLSVSRLQTGLTIYDTTFVEVRNLTFRGYRLDGVNCHDLADRVVLENITFADNGRSGLSVGGASRVTVLDSASSGNGESQIRTEGQCLVELQNVRIEPGDALEIDRAGGRVVRVP